MEHGTCVSIDPEVLGGTPVFNGTRVPISITTTDHRVLFVASELVFAFGENSGRVRCGVVSLRANAASPQPSTSAWEAVPVQPGIPVDA